MALQSIRTDRWTAWHALAAAVMAALGVAATYTAWADMYLIAYNDEEYSHIFLVPVPGMIRQQIAIPLQTWTAQISQVVLEVIGIPVERSVNQLTVNGIPVNIIEACNGLRMVWPLILMSYAFSFGLPLRNSVRFLVLAASPLAAIFCNVVRILPTIWLYSNHTKPEEKWIPDLFHDYSGWLMLPIAFLILLGLIKTLRWAMIPVMRYTLAS